MTYKEELDALIKANPCLSIAHSRWLDAQIKRLRARRRSEADTEVMMQILVEANGL